jgi:hypothetical protein
MRALIFAMLVSMPVFAGDKSERTVCPNVTEDARLLLGSVQTLLEDLRKAPECQGLVENMSVVNRVISSGKWKEIKNVLQGDSSSLEGDDIEALSTLANDAAYALTDSIAMLSGRNSHCLEKQNKPSFLSTLAGITREVSGVVGSVTGPYGVGVALGGNLLSGAISGIDKLYKQNKLYDFSKPTEESLFMNQFCAFAQAQQDIADFLELDKKVEELRGMEREYLTNSKIKDLVENCPECNAYKLAWEAKEDADKLIAKIIADADVDSAPVNQRTSFTRCAQIHRAVYSSESDLNKLVRLLKNYQNPLMAQDDKDLIDGVVRAVTALPEIYPSYEQCIRSDNQAISTKFNDWIRDDILTLNNSIFGQQLTVFRREANRRYRDPNGDYMATSLERVKWARGERDRVIKKLQEPNYLVSKQVVIEQRQALRQRLLTKLMPSYLRYRFRDNQRHITRFTSDFKRFTQRELRYFNGQLATPVSSIPELTAALRTRPDIASYFVSSYDQIFNDSQVILLEVINNKRYCDYLLYSRSMVPENRAICDAQIAAMNQAMEGVKNFDGDLKAIVEFNDWADAHLSIQSTYVRDYADRIREWTARGDSRWELVN